MTIYCPTDPPELATILARIRQKREDYERYGFTFIQGRTLRAFFDLAQEFETLENFYRVCVFVPKEFMGFDSCLYLVDPDIRKLYIACDSIKGLRVCGMDPPGDIRLSESSYETGDTFVAPIKGNWRLFASKPLSKAEEIIGLFAVFPLSGFGKGDRLFFEKYANRIGYNLHYKLISEQNERHIKFINTLVADIEHNVLVPNMRYRLFLNNLRKKILELEDIEKDFGEKIGVGIGKKWIEVYHLEQIQGRLADLRGGLFKECEEIDKHYQNTSLFLESLLRRDHFEKGQLVLRRKMCRFKKEILAPQLERYRQRLERMGIRIDYGFGGIPDEDIPLAVDVGLISQVYANLFSNAEKYCQEVINESGEPVKFMSYGQEVIPDFFGPGKPGIKFNVFTTGPHIPPEEASHIFEEGYRGTGSERKPGVGHGLHFVKKVVEVHGGVVGYEAANLGNNFFFALPLQNSIEEIMGLPVTAEVNTP
ncbi:MAG: sensor histidine kinase [Deltaproteobacteria bacterium]|nr:sensor histidine kinase [Deltaproteobacteria bacterium]MBW1966506.1 sensor histidine kinase [Deltaproteobacteria bacterium]MBW2097621.1 sensor histidine kinase [Deltaproteobacteria bacterium]